MAIQSLSLQSGLIKSLVDTRQQLIDLQRQLGTGKIADTYGGLSSSSRVAVLSLRGEASQIEGYQRVIRDVDTRIQIAEQSLTRFSDIAAMVKTDVFADGFDLVDGKQTAIQRTARTSFDEMVSLLNSDVNGRYIFAGKATDAPPLASAKLLIEGDATRAGLTQLIDERRQADLGASGLGRLVTNPPAAADVTLSEDVAGSPFGLKLAAISATGSGLSVAGPTGTPAAVTVSVQPALPAVGDKVDFTFTLPDGSQTVLSLTATNSATLAPGQFQIGADENQTAQNLQSALSSELAKLAAGELQAVSAVVTANDFFGANTASPPNRVVGPPFDSATALAAGTPADTVIWYTGDTSADPARQSALAKIDDKMVLAYGTRADEEAIRNTLANLALLGTMTFSEADPNAAARYDAVGQRVGQELGFPPGKQSINDIIADITVARGTLAATNERHQSAAALMDRLIGDRENADLNEVGAQILTLQTRLQASLQTTSTLAQLSIVNFI